MATDYGPVRDRTACCLVHPEGDSIILDRLDVFQGSKENRVQIATVKEWIDNVRHNFNVRKYVLDNWQCEVLAQEYEKLLNVERFSFQGDSHYKIAENLKSLIVNRKLRIYPGAGSLTLPNGCTEDLVDELSSLITERQGIAGRYRVNHRPGSHDDRYCALALACWGAVQLPKRLNLNEVLDNLIQSRPDKKEILAAQKGAPVPMNPSSNSDYIQVRHLKSYGEFQSVPIIDGVPIPLVSFPRQEEAAYAVNFTYKLLGFPEPNKIPEHKFPKPDRLQFIEESTLKKLRERRLLPVNAPKAPEKGKGK